MFGKRQKNIEEKMDAFALELKSIHEIVQKHDEAILELQNTLEELHDICLKRLEQ